MDLEDITPHAVGKTLQALRHPSAAAAAPLLGLEAVSAAIRRDGLRDDPATRLVVLADLLDHLVWMALTRLRLPAPPPDRATLTAADELRLLQDDFRGGNDERAAWGAVYFQHFGVNDLPVTALSHHGLPYHTFHRRCARGYGLIAVRLRALEVEARRRRASLASQPPSPPDPDPGGREASPPAPEPAEAAAAPVRRRTTTRIAVLSTALIGLALLPGPGSPGAGGAWGAGPMGAGTAAATPWPSRIAVVGPIEIQPARPRAGEIVTAAFRIRNNAAEPRVIALLRAGARGPHACSRFWNAPIEDFPAERQVRLAPGEEHVYRQSRTFARPGDYFAEPVQLGESGRWGGIGPSPRAWFDVRQAGDGAVLTPDCLVLAAGPTVAPSPVRLGEWFTVTLRLKNNTHDQIALQRLVIAQREPTARQGSWSYPAIFAPSRKQLTLEPGEELSYTTGRRATEPGTFALEAVVQQDGKWAGIWPFAVVTLQVVGAP